MCPATTNDCQKHQQLVSFNNNNHLQQQQQPTIFKLENDDDYDDLFLHENVQKGVPTIPSPQQIQSPPLPCLVETTGQLDYHDACLCVKCRLVKEFLPCEPECAGKDCREGAIARLNEVEVACYQQHQSQYHNRNVTDDANEVTHPQIQNGQPINPQQNIEQQEIFPPEHAHDHQVDDDRYSKCSTLDNLPVFKDDDDYEMDNKEVEEEMEESKSNNCNDCSSDIETNQKMPIPSCIINNKKGSSSSTKSNECPLCKSVLSSRANMLTHYRVMHLGWKPFYCKWTKCAFVSGYSSTVETHVQLRHLNKTVNIHEHRAEDYVGKRDDDQRPTDALLSAHLLNTIGVSCPVTSTTIGTSVTAPEVCVCPKCSRRFARPDLLEYHLESHNKNGFQCIWPNCGHFYSASILTTARRHVCHDHLGNTDIYPGFRDMKRAKKYLQLVSVNNPAFSFATSTVTATQPTTSFALTNQDNNGDDTKVTDVDGPNDSSEHHSFDDAPVRINGQYHCRYKNCSKSFPGRSHILEHELIHTGKKPFGCTSCTFVSCRESSVASHFRAVHYGNELYRCTFNNCGHSYSVHTDIVTHIQMKHHLEYKNLNWKSVVNKYVEKLYLAPRRK